MPHIAHQHQAAPRQDPWRAGQRLVPVGVEGVDRTDDLKEENGVLKLGALAVGGPKMKLQKRCVQLLFETKGAVFDLEGVYEVAVEVLGSPD